MDTLPPELLELIFQNISIKCSRQLNKCIKNAINNLFINSIYVDKNSKYEFFNIGNTCILLYNGIHIYNNKNLVHSVECDFLCSKMANRFFIGERTYKNMLYNEDIMSIDLLSSYIILKNKEYELPKDFAKNKILSMLNSTRLWLYVESANQYYYLWLVATAMRMGLLPYEYIHNIETNTNATQCRHGTLDTYIPIKEYNKQLFGQIMEHIKNKL